MKFIQEYFSLSSNGLCLVRKLRNYKIRYIRLQDGKNFVKIDRKSGFIEKFSIICRFQNRKPWNCSSSFSWNIHIFVILKNFFEEILEKKFFQIVIQVAKCQKKKTKNFFIFFYLFCLIHWCFLRKIKDYICSAYFDVVDTEHYFFSAR